MEARHLGLDHSQTKPEHTGIFSGKFSLMFQSLIVEFRGVSLRTGYILLVDIELKK